ncbi:MAG TPA: HTTM domain-containing protein, partial [Polyangiaceae bacterium]|nr:HTTM domain-containing protein [Polyangiaceae bacterium]
MKRHYELVPPAAAPTPDAPRGVWQKLVRLYGTADPRSLGLLRIALATVLAVDVLLKFPDVAAHFSNSGWLANHFALFRPMSDHLFSVYLAFSSPHEVEALLGVHLVVCLLLLIGWHTKPMQLLALLLTTSLNSRNILLENGGSVVLDILLVWTAFLPLGARFSVDALRASWRARQETSERALNERLDPPRASFPYESLAVTALLLQWVVIYGFNAVQKTGAPWRDGSAVYYFLQQDRLVTWFGAWLRGVLPLGGVKLLTFSTLLIEGALPLLLLTPWRSERARVLAFGLAVLLHLGIDSVLQLGAFSWAMLVAFVAFLPPSAWEWAKARLRARRVPCVVHFDPSSGASLALCRLVKRLDALGLVTFRARAEDSPKKSEKSLCVSVNGEKSVSGWDALLAIS